MISKFLSFLCILQSKLVNKNHICIACFPKSGSTYLSRFLGRLFEYDFEYITYRFDSEQTIYEPFLLDKMFKNTITHIHLSPTRRNLNLIKNTI